MVRVWGSVTQELAAWPWASVVVGATASALEWGEGSVSMNSWLGRGQPSMPTRTTWDSKVSFQQPLFWASARPSTVPQGCCITPWSSHLTPFTHLCSCHSPVLFPSFSLWLPSSLHPAGIIIQGTRSPSTFLQLHCLKGTYLQSGLQLIPIPSCVSCCLLQATPVSLV